MAYTVILKPTAERDFKKLAPDAQRQVLRVLDALQENPDPPGVKKLTGAELYRVRTGDYRVVYSVERKILHVLVVKIGHRRELYRDRETGGMRKAGIVSKPLPLGKGELTALTVGDVDAKTCARRLATKFSKGRKDSRQPLQT